MPGFSTKKHVFLLWLTSALSGLGVRGQGIMSSSQASGQCTGTFVDYSRLENLEDTDFSSLIARSHNSTASGNTISFAAREISQVRSKDDNTLCLAERHRMREQIDGIPVYGADFVITTNDCSRLTSIQRRANLNTNTMASMDRSFVRSIAGYRVASVDVRTGYTPNRSEQEAATDLARIYGVSTDHITEIKLEVYPTTKRDYRAWIATILVDTVPGEPHVYHVVMDDDDEEIIFQCEMAGFHANEKRDKKLRQRRAQSDKASLCSVGCAQQALQTALDISWNPDHIVDCDVQTIYLNNDGRKSLCISGTDSDGAVYYSPGQIPQYFWNGTLNCGGRNWCSSFYPLPDCPDPVSDVQFGAVNYMRYLQENLGIMGGLSKDADNPVYVLGTAHYNTNYCNAFYLPGTQTVYFGDCDCEQWTPMVSTDVVVHEITHGLTSESSNLLYFGQSGGLNEAYSDIMACALEFDIDDDKDKADFLVGEALADTALRSMEAPFEQDGESVDDYCTFVGAMNVHHSSGFLNRAFFNSVKSCESTCGSSASECVPLMANMFMYTNLESLSMLSGFKDAAKHTCRDVEEFFEANSPNTTCTVGNVRTAVIEGFAAVGLRVNEKNCNPRVSCKKQNAFVQMFNTCSNLVDMVKMITGRVGELNW